MNVVVAYCRKKRASQFFSTLQEVKICCYINCEKSEEVIHLISEWIADDFPSASFSFEVWTDNSRDLRLSWPDVTIRELKIDASGYDKRLRFRNNDLEFCPSAERLVLEYADIDESVLPKDVQWKLLRLISVKLCDCATFIHALKSHAKELQRIEIAGDCEFSGFKEGKEAFAKFLKRQLPNIQVECS